MTWTRNAITGVWSLASPSGREAVVFSQAWPGNSAVRLSLTDPDHRVRVLLPCSKDARTAFEIGTDATTPVSDEPGSNAIKRFALGLLARLPIEWMM